MKYKEEIKPYETTTYIVTKCQPVVRKKVIGDKFTEEKTTREILIVK